MGRFTQKWNKRVFGLLTLLLAVVAFVVFDGHESTQFAFGALAAVKMSFLGIGSGTHPLSTFVNNTLNTVFSGTTQVLNTQAASTAVNIAAQSQGIPTGGGGGGYKPDSNATNQMVNSYMSSGSNSTDGSPADKDLPWYKKLFNYYQLDEKVPYQYNEANGGMQEFNYKLDTKTKEKQLDLVKIVIHGFVVTFLIWGVYKLFFSKKKRVARKARRSTRRKGKF